MRFVKRAASARAPSIKLDAHAALAIRGVFAQDLVDLVA